jgi:hypothetical protein
LKTKAYCRYCCEPVYENDGEHLKPKAARTIYYHRDCAKKVEEEWRKINEEKEILQYKAASKN